MTPRPEILVIIGHYLPGTRMGGPIRTTSNMVHWMGDEFHFKILTSDRDLGADMPYPNIRSGTWQPVGKASVRYLDPRELGLKQLRRAIIETSYDMIYLDSMFPASSLKTLLLYKLGMIPRKPLVIVPRGMLNSGALSLKTTKKQTFLRIARWIGFYSGLYWHVSNESERNDVLRELRVGNDERIWVIPNLPSPLLRNHTLEPQSKQAGTVRLVFLSRISRKKNLHFALELLRQVEGQIQFDIYGALEDAVYWHECQDIIAQLPDRVRVAYKGEVAFDTVLDTFTTYHLFALPTLGENFGHVILEALCAGCPVLISDQTPWSGINAAGAGWALPLDQPARFAEALQTMVAMDEAEFNALAERAHAFGKAYVDNPALVDQMRQFFKHVLQTS